MNPVDILLSIDAEISRLEQVRELLRGTSNDRRPTRKSSRPARTSGRSTSFNPAEFPAPTRRRRKLSADGRAKIAAAQRARWAKIKKDSGTKRSGA